VRGVVLAVANEPHVQAFLTNGPGRALARRFVAGETLDEALQSARELGRQGARVSLDYLGESIHSLDEALAARAVYRDTIGRSATELTIPSSFSLKPSQFGLDLDRNRSLELLADVVAEAMRVPTGVRLDMEDSAHTDGTLWLADELAQRGLPVGVVLQAALYRTPGDLDRVLARGGSVRLCKGAYREPASLAYPRKPDVDAAYARLLERLLRAAPQVGVLGPGQLPPAAIATHDPRLVAIGAERAYIGVKEVFDQPVIGRCPERSAQLSNTRSRKSAPRRAVTRAEK